MRSQPGWHGPRKPVRAAPRRIARFRARSEKDHVPFGGSHSLGDALRNRYVLGRELGHGGMATVYLAVDVKRDRPVALKAMRADLASTLGRARFQREIEIARRLDHPRIVTVLDSGESAGQPWFTMPFVTGESLRDRLRREGRLAVTEAVRITGEAAQALGHAHRRGIIHRDVKPENLLLTESGSTLLTDFGVAFPVGSAQDENLTGTGLSIGTPAYIAPEQATGRQTVDARADQYALAVTCYEMLVGATPFTGPTTAAVIAQRFSRSAPNVRAARPDVPPRVARAVVRALSLDPENRFGSVEEFVAALAGDAAGAADRRTAASRPGAGPVGLATAALRSFAWIVSLLGALSTAFPASAGSWSMAGQTTQVVRRPSAHLEDPA